MLFIAFLKLLFCLFSFQIPTDSLRIHEVRDLKVHQSARGTSILGDQCWALLLFLFWFVFPLEHNL